MSDRRSVFTTEKINTPEILTAAGDAIAKNADRNSWNIQNCGTNPLFVRLGTGASTTVFHRVLKGGTANDDGLGGSFGESQGTVYGGIISVAGTSPRYVVRES